MKKLFILILFVLLILISGCISNELDSYDSSHDPPCNIEDYDNGVLYFGCTEENFAISLSDYKKKYPDVVIESIAMVPNVGTNNYAKGYIVVTDVVKL